MCQGKKSSHKKADKEEQYRRVFRHLDVDGDGRISAEELRRCVEMTQQEEEAEEAARAQLGIEEFVRRMMEADEDEEEEEEERGLKEAFSMYEEVQGSGRITPNSLKRMLSRLGDKRSVGECKEMISVFDLDGDGVLSFHEFKVMMS